MEIMQGLLKDKVAQRIAELRLSLPAAAEACGLDYSTLLAVRYGRTKRPGEDVLLGLERGLRLSYRELALAAYGIPNADDPAGADDTLEKGVPPASNRVWTQTGKPLRRASAATS